MFYSHAFLAKKSPLGTVWIAAHLERRIKKHQLDEIDIRSYAECIMFPEVPIALRLSGHLLYGLVRIYALKVKYLVQDCNRMVDDIRTVFTSIQVDLPVDADRAPFESVTLPSTLDLDAVELVDAQLDGPDNHRKTYDQITLQDQLRFEGEQYVSIYINEDNRLSSSPGPVISNPGAGPMEQDIIPPVESEFDGLATSNKNGLDGRDLGPRHPMEDDVCPPFEDELEDLTTTIRNAEADREHAPNDQTDVLVHDHNQDHFSHEPAEVMRNVVDNTELDCRDAINDASEVNQPSVPSLNRNGNLSPIVEGLSGSGGGSFPSPALDREPTVPSPDDLDILNTGIFLDQNVPDMELQPSPPVNQQVRNRRKRKQFFDETIVLLNVEMRQQVKDTSALVCKRRKLPCSALDLWRFNLTRRKEQILYDPLFSGMCPKIQEVFERRFPPSISNSASFEASSGPMDAPEPSGHMDAPQLSGHMDAPVINPIYPNIDMEPEHPRSDVHVDEITHDLRQSSPAREEFNPSNVNNLSSTSNKGKSYEPEILPTFGHLTSTEPVGPELTTPSVNWEEHLHLDDTNLEIPSIQNSVDIEELTFLEASNASSGYDSTEVGTMSTRTRKVAQYLKDLSPDAHTPEEQSACVSLNRILEGKTRKACARMFFETLVLKSCGFIDVHQEEPYGDILISRTPVLSSIKF